MLDFRKKIKKDLAELMTFHSKYIRMVILTLAAILISWVCCRVSQFNPVSVEEIRPDIVPEKKLVVGYFPFWKSDDFNYASINYAALTHLAHAFVWPDAEGNLFVDEDFLIPEMNREAHLNGVKMILSVGGAGSYSDAFAEMASSPEKRSRFIDQLVNFCSEFEYDGIDLDWEFIENDYQGENFVYLVEELWKAVNNHNPDFTLSTVSPTNDYWGKWIRFEELVPFFDFIGAMTYNYHGAWSDRSGHNSPMFDCNDPGSGSIHSTYLYLLNRGIPREKLLLGIPFHGKSFDSKGLNKSFTESSHLGYSQALGKLADGWKYNWDECARVPYLVSRDRKQVISFDDQRSIAIKCQYIQQWQVGGAIIWELSQGYDTDSGRSPLLDVVAEQLRLQKPPNE